MERWRILNNSGIVRGEKVTGKPRKSKTYGEGRVCKDTFCKQVLSKYNHNEFCFNHAPRKIPRNRGHAIR